MQKRSERMQKVFQLSESEEQAECRTMGRAQRRLDEEVARLEELKAYRKSYGDRSKQLRQVNSAQWKDYQSFLERLDQAIVVQTRVVLEGRQNCDVHRRRWIAKRHKAESLERVVTRFRDEEGAEREKTLQNEADDRAPRVDLVPGVSRRGVR